MSAIFGIDDVHHAGFAAVGHLEPEFAVRSCRKCVPCAATEQLGRGRKKIPDTEVHQLTHQTQTAEGGFRVNVSEVAETGRGGIN